MMSRDGNSNNRMSHCVVPNLNNQIQRHQRQEQVQAEEENRSNSHLNTTHDVHIPDYRQVKEITWENGQIAMHGLSGLLSSGPTKPFWARTGDTLESIVHQATCHARDTNFNVSWAPPIVSSNIAAAVGPTTAATKKRGRTESDSTGTKKFNGSGGGGDNMHEDHAGPSGCASASATFCRDSDTTMVTWASFDSPNNLKTKNVDGEDSSSLGGGLENQEEEQETKGESGRSNSARRSRAAAVHNQSERRRRDRINQKMKALQKMVPNASKTDKASMLDEVIDYLKQLQAQVQLMNTVRNMQSAAAPQMVMPLGLHHHQQQQQQHHLQMSLLAAAAARMGMGMGMGVFDMNSLARAASATHQSIPQLLHPNALAAAVSGGPTFVAPQFMVPPHMVPTNTKPLGAGGSSSGAPSVALPDPYCTLLAQSMNMELYNKMAALYSQQVNQTMPAMSSPSRTSHVPAD